MAGAALIVEDEIMVALDLENILVSAGYHVVEIAADREHALQAAPQCSLAFVDVNLRDGATGPDIATALTRDFGVRVIFVTANPAHITADTGAIAFVRKPFSDVAIRTAAAIASAQAQPAMAAGTDVVLLHNDNMPEEDSRKRG